MTKSEAAASPPTRLRGPIARRVLRRLASEHEEIAAQTLDLIRAEHAAYRMIPDDGELEALRAGAAESIRIFARWTGQGRSFSEEELAFFRAQAAENADRLIPLEVLLQAIRVGQRIVWRWIIGACGETAEGREAALALLAELVDFCDRLSAVFAEAYLDRQLFAAAEEDRLRRDVVEDLLSARPTRDRVRARAAAFGLEGAPYLVVVARVRPGSDRETLRAAAAAVSSRLAPDTRKLLVVRHEEIVGILARADADGVAERLRQAVRLVAETHDASLLAGLSMPAASLTEIAGAYEEAVRALALAERDPASVVSLGNVPLLRYLVAQADGSARRIAPQSVRDLLEEDDRMEGSLVRTLLAYLEADLNAGRTAELLVVHPNTVHYRLRRIADVTGRNTRSFHDLLELYVGILVLGQGSGRAGPEA